MVSQNIIEVPAGSGLNFNVGLGANYWISKKWGLNASATAKFKLKAGEAFDVGQSNYVQYNFGIFYSISN